MIIATALLIGSCGTLSEKTTKNRAMVVDESKHPNVSETVIIDASRSRVWDIITNPQYAKILGAIFDKDAFVESDWELESEVHFKYEPDKIASTGKVGKLIREELIVVEYDFDGFEYSETYKLEAVDNRFALTIMAGPYSSDYEDQVKVWGKWLRKVAELCVSD